MFKDSIVALITPMNEKGAVCRHSLKKLIDYHINNGTNALVSVGTTGEASTLDQNEHSDIVMLTLDLAKGRIPIIAGTGSNSTEEGINLTKKFEYSGISACLTVAPYYNKPNQEGLYQHFKAIAESTSLPQLLYNVPSRTGCDILPHTVGRLSKIKNIIGIKDATGDLSRVSETTFIIKNKKFILLSGDDATALDFIKLGGNGVISVTANIAAKQMSEICYFARKKKFVEASKINNKLMLLHKVLFIESNPIPIKWAAKRIGLIKNSFLRLPMTSIKQKNKLMIEKALKKAKIIISK